MTYNARRSGSFGNSWKLMKVSLGIIRKDKHLLIFPLISSIISIAIVASFVSASFFFGYTEANWVSAMFIFIVYFVLYFVAIYFNAALIGCATISLSGGNPKVSYGLSLANRRIGRLLGWTFVSATIGLILQVGKKKTGLLGRIILSIVGIAWAIATFFIIPVLLYEDKGVWESLKSSGSIFRRTWGETLISRFAFGLIFLLLFLMGFLPIIIGLLVLEIVGLLIGLVIAIIYWAILFIVIEAAKSILVAALYRYAKSGKIASDYQHVAYAFESRY